MGRAGDRDIIISGSDDGTLRSWDAGSGDAVAALLEGHDGPLRAVAVGRAGDRDIIVSGARNTVRIWDAVTGHPVAAPLVGH